jgi:putative Holliday junction resolvase
MTDPVAPVPPPQPRPAHGTTTGDVAAFAAVLPAGARLIGIDGGTKRLGLAISDVTRMIASPLGTIVRRKFSRDAADLLALVAEHRVGGLVLGLPANLDGSEGPRAQATRAFARNLNAVSPLPVLLWDERLTTVEAERMLIAADASRQRRSEVIDKVAATLILQGALDRLRTTL